MKYDSKWVEEHHDVDSVPLNDINEMISVIAYAATLANRRFDTGLVEVAFDALIVTIQDSLFKRTTPEERDAMQAQCLCKTN